MSVLASPSRPTGRRSHLRSLAGDHGAELKRAAVVTVVILLVGFTFTASYVGALYNPGFHGVPLAAAGPKPLISALGSGGAFTLHPVPSRAQALQRIDDHRDFGAVVATPQGIDVLTAKAANAKVAAVLGATLPAKLSTVAGSGVTVHVQDVKPLPASDPTGLVPFYLVLSLIVCSFVGTGLFGMVFGTKIVGRAIWGRLLGCGVIALVLALAQVGIVLAIGAISGHYLALVLAGLLLGLATVGVAIGLQALLGFAGSAISMMVFVVLGNPASGVVFPPQLLPGFWRGIGPYLPAGAGINLVKGIVYFGGHGTAGPILIVTAWLALGFGSAGLAYRRTRPAGVYLR